MSRIHHDKLLGLFFLNLEGKNKLGDGSPSPLLFEGSVKKPMFLLLNVFFVLNSCLAAGGSLLVIGPLLPNFQFRTGSIPLSFNCSSLQSLFDL